MLDANRAFLEMFGVERCPNSASSAASSSVRRSARRTSQMALLDRDGSVREFEIEIAPSRRRDAHRARHLLSDPRSGDRRRVHPRHPRRHHVAKATRGDARRDEHARRADRRAQPALSHAGRPGVSRDDPDRKCGCLFVDIDHFKIYNDRWGHVEGDEVLKRMARFLMRSRPRRGSSDSHRRRRVRRHSSRHRRGRNEARRRPASHRGARPRAGAVLARMGRRASRASRSNGSWTGRIRA